MDGRLVWRLRLQGRTRPARARHGDHAHRPRRRLELQCRGAQMRRAGEARARRERRCDRIPRGRRRHASPAQAVTVVYRATEPAPYFLTNFRTRCPELWATYTASLRSTAIPWALSRPSIFWVIFPSVVPTLKKFSGAGV